jgi:cytochrome P450
MLSLCCLTRVLVDTTACSWFGSIMIEAGAETTSTFLASFVLLLAAHPAVAKKVQEEMDRVVGNDRLPELDDYQRLPYLQAVVNEVRF